MLKRKNQDVSKINIKRQKRNIFVPNEIIIKIFNYFIDDLFEIEYYVNGDVKVQERDDQLYPMNLIKNIFLTSKNFNNLFKSCFKERIIKKYNIDLELR